MFSSLLHQQRKVFFDDFNEKTGKTIYMRAFKLPKKRILKRGVGVLVTE